MPKRIQRRRRGGAVGTSSIPRNFLSTNFAGVSPSLRRTLAWYGAIGSTLSSTYSENTVVILNSPYDPDAALGGVSAAGFAKYMAMYSKCFVTSARIIVKYALAGTSFEGSPSGIVHVGVTITTYSTSIGSLFGAVTAGLVEHRVHNINPDSGTFSLAVDIAKFIDKPFILDDPQLFCTSGANPGQIVCAHIWTNNVSLANPTILGGIDVEYDCTFTDPIPFS